MNMKQSDSCFYKSFNNRVIYPLALIAIGALALISCGGGGGGGGGPDLSGQGGITGGTVTVDLLSVQAGTTVPPGQTIDWSLLMTVSAGDNAGLALFSADLVQDAGNPAFLDLPAGERAPAGMEGFDRPGGFTNPSTDPWGSGYGGTPVGESGSKNLTQVGGAQNTFGIPGPKLGPNSDVLLGQDVDVDPGVGQAAGGQIVATGSFAVPATPGNYTFHVTSVLAATLDSVNTSPDSSPVTRSAVTIGTGSFTVAVSTLCDGSGYPDDTASAGADRDGGAEGRADPPASPAERFLPAEGALLNRTHMQFRWPSFEVPPASYSLWIVEDDGSSDPFGSGAPLMEHQVAADEPRIVVTSGLSFGKDYAWQVTDGGTPSVTGSATTQRFTTITLPTWAPTTSVDIPPGAGPTEPGLTLFNGPCRDGKARDRYYDYLIAVDQAGEIIYFLKTYGNGWFSDVRLLEQGRILTNWGKHDFEINLDGRILWKPDAGYEMHHEVFPMPGGSILALARERRTYSDGSDATEWVGDRIVELDRHTREEIWSWSVFDHYSRQDGGPPGDWTHGNSAVYVEKDDSIYYSARHVDRITRIDYRTGSVVYHMGMDCPSGDNDFGHNLFSKQHAPQILPNGNMMVYDNGNDRIPLTDPRQTKGIEIAFDHPTAPTDGWIVWEHALTYEGGAPQYCEAWGDVDRLPNGNTLITGGADKTIVEVDAASSTVWKLTVHGTGTSHIDRIYRAERIPALIVDAPGDCDGDWDLDLIDLAAFQTGFTGPGAGSLDWPARLSDCDGDGDVDGDDLASFGFWMNGAYEAYVPTD